MPLYLFSTLKATLFPRRLVWSFMIPGYRFILNIMFLAYEQWSDDTVEYFCLCIGSW